MSTPEQQPRSLAEEGALAWAIGSCTLRWGAGPCPSCGYSHNRLEPLSPCTACGATDQVVMVANLAGSRYCKSCRKNGGPRWER